MVIKGETFMNEIVYGLFFILSFKIESPVSEWNRKA